MEELEVMERKRERERERERASWSNRQRVMMAVRRVVPEAGIIYQGINKCFSYRAISGDGMCKNGVKERMGGVYSGRDSEMGIIIC